MQNANFYKKLDNPVWFSLSETHHPYSIDHEAIKFYHPDYCPFGGCCAATDRVGAREALDAYAARVDSFFIVGDKPLLPNSLCLNKEVVCLQMVLESRIDQVIKDPITPLTPEHAEALFQLVNLVQPGYFKPKTSMLGNYAGIIKEGKLLAVAGERMIMDDFVEVSAIVTHPDHTGQGYAKQLIAYIANAIFDRQKTPYLHVVESNIGAIGLYEKLGFATRRKISFWNIGKL